MKEANIFVANWKMNGNQSSVSQYIKEISASKEANTGKTKIIFCPPSLYTAMAAQEVAKQGTKNIAIGVQCISHINGSGAQTGFVNAQMAKDVGCQYAIVAHSELRSALGYGNQQVAQIAFAAIANGITPIVCFGESIKKEGSLEKVGKDVAETFAILSAMLEEKPAAEQTNIIIAYEPIWSIGSGETPTTEYILGAIGQISAAFMAVCKMPAQFIYGGSVAKSNIKEITSLQRLSGVIVGGASLSYQSMLEMLEEMES